MNLENLAQKIIVAKLEGESNEEYEQRRENEAIKLCLDVQEILMQEPNVLQVTGKFIVCGDMHGSFDCLSLIFGKYGFPPLRNYIFLGDFVNRGEDSVHVVLMLFLLKRLYPNNIFLIRGNHEISEINVKYGLEKECKDCFNGSSKVFYAFNQTFMYLPICCLVNDSILCLHGGISPRVKTIEQINSCNRIEDSITDQIIMDILWSDPLIDDVQTGIEETLYKENDSRRTGVYFSEDALKEFCKRNGIKCVIRGHQAVENGYQYAFDNKLLTIFSSPPASGDPAAASIVDNNEIKIIRF